MVFGFIYFCWISSFYQQGEFPTFIPDESFTQGSYKPEEVGVKQHPIICKQEPLSNGLKSTLSPEQSAPQPLIVSNTDFPGKYCFDIGYEEEKGPPTKSVQWTYSPYLDKLFLKMRCIVPFRIKLQGEFFLLLTFFIDIIINYYNIRRTLQSYYVKLFLLMMP